MSLKALSLALATTAVTALTLPALAQDKTGVNVGAAAEGAAPGAASTMGLAQELFALGVAQGDAVTVLAAAKLAASVEVKTAEAAALDPSKVTFGEGVDATTFRKKAAPAAAPAAPAPMMNDGTPRAVAKATFFNAANEDEGAADAPVTADAMFAKAKELATDDEALLGLIDDAMAETGRGRIGGAVEWLSRLPSGQTDVWEIPYYGNSYAEVAIVGDGDANLDVAVTDENGNVICYDVSWSDKLYCDWTPAWDGYFYVTVQNMGGSRNSYYLMTN
jgi:Fe2+ transport system protein FeoA